MTDFHRLEMSALEEAIDWRRETGVDEPLVNEGQLKLEADMLAQAELDLGAGVDSPAGATTSRAKPAAKARGALPVKRRLLVESLEESAAFYERNGKLRAAEVAHEMADKARRG